MAPRDLILGLLAACILAMPGMAGDRAYVTNQNSSDLSVLDLERREEIARLPVPGNPAGITVGADGSFYTVSPDSKTVRRFDATGKETAHIVLDGGPIGVALAGEKLFVSDWYNARIWVLTARTLDPIGTLATGSAPAGLAVSPDNLWLASAGRDAGQVSVFDLDTLRLHRRLPVGTRPFGLAFAPDGRLFVGNVGSDDVTVLDKAIGMTLANIPVGARPYGVAFARGRAFVTNQYADTVSVIDLATLTPIAEIAVGEYPEGIDATGDGRTLVVANWFSNTVSLIDAERLAVTGEITTGDGPRAFGRFVTMGELR